MISPRSLLENTSPLVGVPSKAGATPLIWCSNKYVLMEVSLVKFVADSTQGFELMLAGLKALLEHDVRLNLVADRYPKGVDDHRATKA